MASVPLKVRVVVVALVRRGFRYLMVRDDSRGGTWYPPAGALEVGEDLISGAERVVGSAAGCTPEVTGLVSIFHMPLLPGRDEGRWRYVVEGKVAFEALSEQTAVGRSQYLLPAEIRALPLRNDDALGMIEDHAGGQRPVPIDLYRVGLG